MHRISVVIPCRNERKHIREFLESIARQQIPDEWSLEILVADGMSDDGTREILHEYCAGHANVRMIDNPGLIVSTGLNAAIAAASGEVIVRMDAHTVYASDYIYECVRALEETGADNVGGPWVARGNGVVGRAIAAAFRSPFCTGGGKAHKANYNGEADTVYLGCWRRSAFEKAGLFDPELVRNQDDEFNFRLRRLGGKVVQSTRIRSVYTPRNSLGALFRQYLQYGFWKVAVMRKHRGLASWRHAAPGLFVSSLILLLAMTAIAALWGGAAAAGVPARILAAEITVYALASVVSALTFVGELDWRALVLLPVVTAVYHFAYGAGFLIGLVRPPGRTQGESRLPRLFTALTR
jgi:succinoglycan biosynthesis protein ExoA